MYFLILLLFLLVAIIEERTNKKLVIIPCIIMAYIFAYNKVNPDLENYEKIFKTVENLNIDRYEKGFLKIIEICKNNGLFFDDFRLIISIIVMVLIYKFLYKSTNLPSYLALNFFIIVFFINYTQMRSFIAIAIFLYAISNLYNKKFLMYSIIALLPLFHRSMGIFWLFLIYDKMKLYRVKKMNILIPLLGMCLIIFFPKDFLEILIKGIHEKYLVYLSKGRKYYGTLVLIAPYYLMNLLCIKDYFKNFKYKRKSNEIKQIISVISFSNYILLFSLIIRDFLRISTNLYIFNVIYFIWREYNYGKSIKKYKLVVMLIITIVIFYIEFLLLNPKYFLEIKQSIESTF